MKSVVIGTSFVMNEYELRIVHYDLPMVFEQPNK